MTQIAIQKQLEAIKVVTEKALRSKEASRKILIDAGIIKEKKDTGRPAKDTKK